MSARCETNEKHERERETERETERERERQRDRERRTWPHALVSNPHRKVIQKDIEVARREGLVDKLPERSRLSCPVSLRGAVDQRGDGPSRAELHCPRAARQRRARGRRFHRGVRGGRLRGRDGGESRGEGLGERGVGLLEECL